MPTVAAHPSLRERVERADETGVEQHTLPPPVQPRLHGEALFDDAHRRETFEEAAELAALRRQVHELNAVAEVTQQMALQEENAVLLKRAIAEAKATAAQQKRDFDAGLEPTWKPRKVVVNNYTTEYLDVYVNGNYKTQVQPGMQQTIIIEHRWNPTVLKAFGNEDINTFGPRYVWGRFDTYTWNIE